MIVKNAFESCGYDAIAEHVNQLETLLRNLSQRIAYRRIERHGQVRKLGAKLVDPGGPPVDGTENCQPRICRRGAPVSAFRALRVALQPAVRLRHRAYSPRVPKENHPIPGAELLHQTHRSASG